MAKTTNSIVTIGLSAFALPAAAQDYYAGASFGFGDYVVDDGGSSDETSNPQSLDVFGGARFDVGAKMFVGVEVQVDHHERPEEQAQQRGRRVYTVRHIKLRSHFFHARITETDVADP